MADPRYCEDCDEEIPKGQNRVRCMACGKLVCHWCMNHVHGLEDQTRRTSFGTDGDLPATNP